MIITELYDGQGLGNQLWCYVTTRVLAQELGYRFGIQRPEKFKGFGLMELDFGDQVKGGKGPQGGPPTELPEGISRYHVERGIFHPDGSDIRTTDPLLASLPDGTKIDGIMQDVELVMPYREQIREWLKVSGSADCKDYCSDDVCVINFRGGNYSKDKNFFLPEKYWEDAVAHMRKRNPKFKFVVVTDDVATAKGFFPDFEVNHWSVAKDYSVIHNARHLIISNSSFAWFPAWLSTELKSCIAPKYWARHNVSDGYWSLGYNITPGWEYLDREGNLSDYAECKRELDAYMLKNRTMFDIVQPYVASETYVPPAVPSEKRTHGIKATLYRTKLLAKKKARKFLFSKPISPLTTRFIERKHKRGWEDPSEIARHRKKIQVVDAFTFFNELDLLEIRLNILDPYVDWFVISEATETFSGFPKPLYFKENEARFSKWRHKIIHHVVTDAPKDAADLRSRLHSKAHLSKDELATVRYALNSDTADHPEKTWLREFYMKEAMRSELDKFSDDDFVFISDLDEIWDPTMLIDFSKDHVYKPIQTPYAYYLNNRTNEHWRGWTGTIATKIKNVRTNSLNALRTHRIMLGKYAYIRRGGWHFAFQGGFKGAKAKLESMKHAWYDLGNTIPNLATRVASNKDYRGRNIRLWKDENGLPQYILANKDKYRDFLK